MVSASASSNDAMSLMDAGLQPDDEGVLNLRWNANALISDIWTQYTGRTMQDKEGETYLVRTKFRKALMSDHDAFQLVGTVRHWVNSVTSLSNLRYHHAVQLYTSQWDYLRDWLTEPQFDTMSVCTKNKLLGEVLYVLWNQTSRGIMGHESKASVTRIHESTGTMSSKEEITVPRRNVNFMGMGGNKNE